MISIFPALLLLTISFSESHKSTLSDTNPGSQTIISPLAFAEGLFCFLNYFSEKEGFLKDLP